MLIKRKERRQSETGVANSQKTHKRFMTGEIKKNAEKYGRLRVNCLKMSKRVRNMELIHIQLVQEE